VGADFSTKKVLLNDSEVIVQIWDTAGLERFHHGQLGNAFYRGANGALIVYDCMNEASAEHVTQWRAELHSRFGSEDLPLVIVANKIDLMQAKKGATFNVPEDSSSSNGENHSSNGDGNNENGNGSGKGIEKFLGSIYSNPAVLQYCQSHRYAHVEASAKDGIGIDAAVRTVVMLALENMRTRQRQLRARQRSTSGVSGSRTVQLDAKGFDQYDARKKQCC
jgi:GTPase SAR1 family protein